MSPKRSLVLLAMALATSGCALAPLGKPVPSLATIGAARAAGLPPMGLGSFRLAAGKEPGMDQSISIRTNRLYSPFGSSFSAYLKETLATELRSAGLLDPDSPIQVSAELTDSRIEVPSGPASATLAARFVVVRAGTQVYAKELRANANWTAGFVGAEAVPMAVNHYEQLYRQLVASLLSDPDLQGALKR